MPPEANQPPLIDLGSDFHVEPPRPSARRRPGEWLRRWRPWDWHLRDWFQRASHLWDWYQRPLRIRMAWWGVPLVLILLVAAGSIVPPRSPLHRVARVVLGANASVLVSGGTAIIVDIRNGHNEISVYALQDSRILWTRPLDMIAAATGVRVIDGTVIASTAAAPDRAIATEAFDLDSGERLWRRTDAVTEIDAAGYLLMEPAQSSGTSMVSQVVARTGRVGWQLPIAEGCATAFGQAPDGLATKLLEMCLRPATEKTRSVDAPTLYVVDLATGAVTARRDLTYDTLEADFYLLPPQRLSSPELTIVGDLALVTHNNIPMPTIDAFNVTTLAAEWTGMPITNIDSLSVCGQQICLQEGAAESVIDPTTGKTIPGASAPGTGSRARLVLVPVSPDAPAATYAIPQVTTGVNVAVPSAANGVAWIDVQRPGAGVATPALTRIEPIDGVGSRSCFTSGGYLICATSPAELTVWRLPRL